MNTTYPIHIHSMYSYLYTFTDQLNWLQSEIFVFFFYPNGFIVSVDAQNGFKRKALMWCTTTTKCGQPIKYIHDISNHGYTSYENEAIATGLTYTHSKLYRRRTTFLCSKNWPKWHRWLLLLLSLRYYCIRPLRRQLPIRPLCSFNQRLLLLLKYAEDKSRHQRKKKITHKIKWIRLTTLMKLFIRHYFFRCTPTTHRNIFIYFIDDSEHFITIIASNILVQYRIGNHILGILSRGAEVVEWYCREDGDDTGK